MADNRARITYRDAGRFETFLSTVFHTQAGPALTLAAAPESPSRPAAAGFDVDARRWLARMAGSRNGLLLLADRSAKSRATILDAMAGEWLAANRRMLAVDARRALKLPDAMRLVPRGEWADTIAAASARQADIDVLCIDEITDAQMMDAASAAAADCMVVAGVGAEDGREAMDLLMSLQPQPWSIASSLTGVAVVRAVRKLCAHCHTTAAHDREWVDRLRLSPETIGDTSPAAGGCEHCAHTGFDGLTLVGPAIETNVDLRELLRSGDRGEILREFDRLAGPDAVAGAMTAGIRNDRTTLAELARAFG
jgi:general secretion pathway protein E